MATPPACQLICGGERSALVYIQLPMYCLDKDLVLYALMLTAMICRILEVLHIVVVITTSHSISAHS